MKRPEQLAEEHWLWLEGLWESLPDETVFGLATTEYLYKTAFIHGYKHAIADGADQSTLSDNQMHELINSHYKT